MRFIKFLCLFAILFSFGNLNAQIGNTCSDPILLCDTSGFSLTTGTFTPSGAWPYCFGAAVNQDIWFRFTVIQDGTIAWTFTPQTSAEEFDWALYDS